MDEILALPAGPLAGAALSLAQRTESTPVADHSIRSFFFARLFASQDGSAGDAAYDENLLFAACIMHDLGLGTSAPGKERFEVEGADLAAGLLRQHGVAAADVDRVLGGNRPAQLDRYSRPAGPAHLPHPQGRLHRRRPVHRPAGGPPAAGLHRLPPAGRGHVYPGRDRRARQALAGRGPAVLDRGRTPAPGTHTLSRMSSGARPVVRTRTGMRQAGAITAAHDELVCASRLVARGEPLRAASDVRFRRVAAGKRPEGRSPGRDGSGWGCVQRPVSRSGPRRRAGDRGASAPAAAGSADQPRRARSGKAE